MELDLQFILEVFINLLSFYLGAKIGQKVDKGEKLVIPTPTKVIEEYKENKERKREQERMNTMLENIDRYDGTGLGQKDIE